MSRASRHNATLAPKDISAGRTALIDIAIADLVPNPGNARIHPIAQIRELARSIETFGFNAPILIDRNKQIIAGHARVQAAKLLGLSTVPTVSLEHLSEQQARAYMLADNKIAEGSSWDEKKVAEELKALCEQVLDFDLEATGFDLPEIDLAVQLLDPPDVAEKEDVFSPSDGLPVSRPGDLWILGKHRLFCGSALDASVYDAVLGDERAAGVFTDPPYNVKIDGHAGGAGKTRHREFPMASGEMSGDEFSDFLTKTFSLAAERASPGALIYACMDWRHMAEMLAAGAAAECQLINLCVWVKTNGGMGSLYRSRHELVFVFRSGAEKHVNNVQLGRFGRNRHNVWTYPGANSFARKGREKGLGLHPTVKPVALVADALLDSTKRGDLILDPFMGSGTTIMAAERTGRRCCGVELDPLYVDTAIKRWSALTGKHAQHDSGKSFEDIECDRRART